MKKVNRLGLFVFYDRDSIVDDYVIYMLDDLIKNIDKLVIISNSKLSEDEKNKFNKYNANYIERENIGLDAGALCQYFNNNQEWLEYDEIVYLNDTFYGPIYPFKEVFSVMDKKDDLDFWGLTKGHCAKDEYKIFEDGIIPEHIQTFFMVFRKRLLNSDVFIDYWKNYDIDHMLTFHDVVTKHEITFTKYLADNGFKYDSYVKDTYSDSNYKRNFNNFAYGAATQIIKDKAPFLKRKNMAFNEGDMLYLTDVEDLKRAINYIKEETNYDVGLIWKNILRLYNLDSIKNAFGFFEIIDNIDSNKKEDISAIIKLENKYLIDDILSRLDIFKNYKILTKDREVYDRLKNEDIKVIYVSSNYKDKLIEVLSNIDSKYFTFIDIDDNQELINLIDISMGDIVINNLIKDKCYLSGLIDKLKDNNISMVYAPESINYDRFYSSIVWNYDLFMLVKEVLPNDKLIDYKCLPISFSTSFVSKSEVLKGIDFSLFNKVNDSDFVKVLAIVMSYYGTYMGMYPLIGCNREFALHRLNNYSTIVKKTYNAIYENNMYPVTYLEVLNKLKNMNKFKRIKKKIRGSIKNKYIWCLNHFYYPIRNRYRKYIKEYFSKK